MKKKSKQDGKHEAKGKRHSSKRGKLPVVELDDRYGDIIKLPHHVSLNHPPMPMPERAAQFSAFVAQNGYKDAVAESARVRCEKIELGEDERDILDHKLQVLAASLSECPQVTITYYVPDGRYLTITGRVRKIDEQGKKIEMENGEEIEIDDVYDLDGDFLNE